MVTRALAVLIIVLAGCGRRLTGLISPGDLGPRLTTPEGRELSLIVEGDARGLGALSGWLVEVRGARAFGAVRVADWSIVSGPADLPAYVGRLERRGLMWGLTDRSTGAFVVFEGWPELPVGALVAVEGWIDGPHRVHVVAVTVLRPPDGAGG